jgi:uncharacterized protein (DUF924 family)
MDDAARISDFWFGRLPMAADELDRRMRVWFGAAAQDEQTRRDEDIRTRFGAWVERAANGDLAAWTAQPKGRLGLILLLDQFPRNIHRGTARAFAYDGQALGLALDGMRTGADSSLDPVENIFFYLPLQHSESLANQDRAVAAYRELLKQVPAPLKAAFELTLRYAEEHRAIIARFGRFPHRNRVLGRVSTVGEIEYLETANSFGQ